MERNDLFDFNIHVCKARFSFVLTIFVISRLRFVLIINLNKASR